MRSSNDPDGGPVGGTLPSTRSSLLASLGLAALVLAAVLPAAACTGTVSFHTPGGGGDDDDGPNPTPPPDPGEWAEHVVVRLNRVGSDAATISFGLPVPPGVALTDAREVKVSLAGGAVVPEAQVRETLAVHDADGKRTGVRALQIQLPASLMTGDTLDVDVAWKGGTSPGDTFAPFADPALSMPSPAVVTTTERSISNEGGEAHWVESPHVKRTLYTGREPRVLATYPDGYLAQTRLLGHLTTLSRAKADAKQAGLVFLAEALRDFGGSMMYRESYALNPAEDSVVDPVANFEGWLYDRCATWLVAYTVVGDVGFLREAMRACSYYASQIDDDGFFLGKPDRDDKYSHLRGLYAYYALTGDEDALRAGTAIADLWHDDPNFVAPYADGHLRGPDKLWTERLLGTSLEGLYYGSRLTGDTKYLDRFRAMVDTAYRHITGDAATLALVNPGIAVAFPPQNCWIHTGEQQADAGATDPWCSMWMSELAVDVLLRWQEQSGDERVDEIMVRLTRALRDFATTYFTPDPLGDSFLEPSTCASGERYLEPLYGAGLAPDGSRRTFGDYSDFEHCTDASAITAAGIRGLHRQGAMNGPGVGPFATEGESFVQLHHELAACARMAFALYDRSRRDPAMWTARELEAGLGDPAAFVTENKIGYPRFHIAPQRKFSWWFNMSVLQLGLLADAKVDMSVLRPGAIEPDSCP